MAIETKILTFGTGKIGTVGGNKLMGFKNFTPIQISGNILWLNNDPATMTISGANRVSEWRDSSGNLNHFTQATGGNQPLFVANGINSQNGVYFSDSAENFLNCTFSSPITQAFTIITVFNIDVNSTRSLPVVYDSVAVASSRVLQYWASNFIDVGSPTAVNAYAKTRPFGLINSYVEYNGASTKVYENGILKNTINTGVSDLESLRLGNVRGAATINSRLSGYICEQIVYSRALTLNEQTEINSYINLKYGL